MPISALGARKDLPLPGWEQQAGTLAGRIASVKPSRCRRSPALGPLGRYDQRPVFAIRCKCPMKTGQMDSWFRYQGDQPGDGRSCASLRPRHTVHPVHKIQGFEDDVGGAIAVGCFELVPYPAGSATGVWSIPLAWRYSGTSVPGNGQYAAQDLDLIGGHVTSLSGNRW